jgi:hypothetical protein
MTGVNEGVEVISQGLLTLMASSRGEEISVSRP